MKVFRITPEFRILGLTFHRKSIESQPKILNKTGSISFSDLISVYLKTIDHLILKLFVFIGILQVLRFDFQMFSILEFLTFTHVLLKFENVSVDRINCMHSLFTLMKTLDFIFSIFS